MAVVLDIVGSLVVAMLLYVAIFGATANLNQTQFENTSSMITQSNTVALARIIEHDFVKIGYRAAKPAILAAGPDSLVFRAALDFLGPVKTVKYRLGPTAELTSTKNPRDRMIYREVDGAISPMNLGVTNFALTFFDKYGMETMVRDSIRSIEVNFTAESPDWVIKPTAPSTDSTYSATFWQKTIFPKNL